MTMWTFYLSIWNKLFLQLYFLSYLNTSFGYILFFQNSFLLIFSILIFSTRLHFIFEYLFYVFPFWDYFLFNPLRFFSWLSTSYGEGFNRVWCGVPTCCAGPLTLYVINQDNDKQYVGNVSYLVNKQRFSTKFLIPCENYNIPDLGKNLGCDIF